MRTLPISPRGNHTVPGKNNGFNDDDPRSRVHCKKRLLERLDQISVWPAMRDLLHHIDLGTFGLG